MNIHMREWARENTRRQLRLEAQHKADRVREIELNLDELKHEHQQLEEDLEQMMTDNPWLREEVRR